ncbi:MAG: AEC family transporter [Gammaproteobacteria bacterium]|nr:AEC family transporter [Gammaproteobacteria bacterium]MDH3371542.1 AEC family transporter [Gammaproteobacteria bacterium]MDH3405812.1 AEC family transporter [Gammaproteobacteria bacterium]MDH3563492.1 AEC family transporter [Gammaproteobacteria bacterium]MDH5487511.1 AEC family transporter [Gammaproteobacteria bacterium]
MFVTHLFSIVLPVYVIVAVGYLYSRWRSPDMTAANQINMMILLPALLFHVLSGKDFRLGEYGWLALGGVAIVLGSGLLALPVAKLTRLSYKTFVPPMMFSNAGNIGLPLAVFAFGEQALPAAVVLFLVENGLHFTLGTYLMDHRAHFLKILAQPIVLATLAGIVFSLMEWRVPVPLREAIGLLGQASIPLLLFALGTRLTRIDFSEWRIGLLGALVCPLSGLAIFLLLRPFLELNPLQTSLLLVFSMLPPAVLNYLVAEQYHQEPGKVASIVLLGTLAGFITLPLALAFAL